MHDIKLIRSNPENFTKAMKSRGFDVDTVEILKLDENIRNTIMQEQELQAEKNSVAKKIPTVKKEGGDISELLKRGEKIKHQIPELEAKKQELTKELENILAALPNLLNSSVPEGDDESDNVELRKWGQPKQFDFTPKDHTDLGEALGMLDFKQTAKISGARFSTLTSSLAKMERALTNMMLDINTEEFGYMETCPPNLVKANAVFGVGQLPKFEEDLFKTTNDYYLISTSEVSLTNLVADKIIQEEELPLRFTAYTPCYRSEAGSAGKDTRGMIRQHQFSKVELVSITSPKDSEKEHERMVAVVERILQKLELPYRIVTLCSGDTGFSSGKTYDFEVWLPSQNAYREISSCSNCYDFVARRMKARYKEFRGNKNHFVHTLNGSALAVGRTIVAIMENYQNEDGSITIPKALVPYMSGMEKINGKS